MEERMLANPALRDLVKIRRAALGITQERFSEEMEMSQEWVSKIESGEITQPRPKTLQRMAAVLRVPVTDIYIAANLAKTKADANRIAAELPPDDEDDDALLRVAMSGAKTLTPYGKRLVADYVRMLQETERREGRTE